LRNANPTLVSIALADDHPLMRKALAYLIQNTEGYQVSFQAQNGMELLNHISTCEPPDIILLDINMPDMDGYQALSAIRKKCGAAKVVIFSMYHDDETMLRTIQLGADGYVSKSVNPEDLMSTLEHVYQHGHYYPDSVHDKVSAASRDEIQKNISSLTSRELTFLKYSCAGMLYKKIAEKMNVSKYTVEDYRNSLFRKLNVSSRSALAVLNMKYKIVEVEW